MKKKIYLLVIWLIVFGYQVFAQTAEGYISNNLGRIVEVATPNGILPHPHVLIGWDTNGFVKQANSENTYKLFGFSPSSTALNSGGFNAGGTFGLPSGHDAIEIRFGDSSYYWINNSFTGGNISVQKAPFSFYNVGPRSASNPSITGGTKLCFKVVDQDGNSLYTQGEQVIVYGDLSLPADSMYENLGLLPNNPFVSNYRLIYLLRFGQVSVSYTKNSFSIPDDGVLPPSGTVIRFIPQTVDTAKPYVEHSIEMDTGSHTHVLNYYSFEKPSFELIQAPPRMEIDSNGVITWTTYPYQMGLVYPGLLKTSNNYGKTYKSFTATVKGNFPADSGIVEYKTETSGNRIRFWQRNDGSICYRQNQMSFGMEYPKGTNYPLNYAGGFWMGGIKNGVSDSISVSNIYYFSEFQPGRIMNTGPFGGLIGESFHTNPTFFSLPENRNDWPFEAAYNILGEPLQLSGKDTWTVFNDLDLSLAHAENQNPFSPGLGVEVQRQTFQFNHYPFDNAVLVRYVMINESNRSYDSCYFGLWDDPDIGDDSGDDVSRVDSAMSLMTVFNNPTGSDLSRTAIGIQLLQGPVIEGSAGDSARKISLGHYGFCSIVIVGKKTSMATSGFAIVNPSGEPSRHEGDKTRYFYMKGLDALGNPKPAGPFDLTAVGNHPDQQNVVFSTGPFNFAAGDTQEVWMVYIGGQGVNNAAAVDTVRHYAEWIMNDFKNNQIYKFDKTAPTLSLHALSTQAVNRVRFIINTDEPLVQTILRTTTDTLNLGAMKNGYAADYNISKTGSVNMTLTGKDIAGNVSSITKTYQVTSLNKPAVHGTYTFHPDGQGYLLMSKGEAKNIPDKCMLIGEPVEWIATQNNGSMKVEFGYSNSDLAKIQSRYEEVDVMNLGLYSWDGEQWEPIETSQSSNKLVGTAKGSMMAVFYNPEASNTPKRFALEPNYPNPFNPSTTIRYQLAENSKVTLKIYNLLGQEVKTLINTQQSIGIHSVLWDGTNNHGQRVTSGVYFYRLQADDFVKTRKMVLVK